MKNKSATVLLSLTITMFLGPFAVQAEALNPEQQEIVRQHLSQIPAERIEQMQHDPAARLEFLRSIAATMTPEQQEAFRACWKSMTMDERRQALAKL